jgi:GNAT superfamily N-acetyltransferase
MSDDVTVRLATVDEILPVRKSVLRPNEPVEPSDYDSAPGVQHVGAFVGREPVGCATVFVSPYDDEPGAWQLRGMAVAQGHRSAGIGGVVLQEVVRLAKEESVPLVWANARVPALRFYGRHGFEVVSEEFDYGPASIPHRVIVLRLSGPRRTVASGDFPRRSDLLDP